MAKNVGPCAAMHFTLFLRVNAFAYKCFYYSTTGYPSISQPAYLSGLPPQVTSAATYGCPMDRWSLLTSPYDPTNMAPNGLHSRLPPYMHTLPYTAYPINPGLSPTSHAMTTCGQSIPDTVLAGMSAVRQMQVPSGLQAGPPGGMDFSLGLELESATECKRINSLNSLRLKAKDHAASVQY